MAPGTLHRHTLVSRRLRARRDLVVYVPPGYADDARRRYPVLYMQDGQNLFDPATSFIRGHYWRMNAAADALILAGRIRPIIIVGTYNGGRQRKEEYTPARDPRRGGGAAAIYLDALIEEVKPLIEANYRTLREARHTGVGGSSLGGLFALYAGLERPDVFRRICCMSPSVWWARKTIIRNVLERSPRPRISVWLDIGTNEGAVALEDARQLRAALERRGWAEGRDLRYTEAPGASHDEDAWAQRVAPMLEFLYG
ncbi:MAG: alpha/beta hydrolase [Acidobacteria bacterium]|nr:alpha/beta hydrolase [Acidobacteriota bacterium]